MAESRRSSQISQPTQLSHQMVVYGLSDRGLRRDNNEDHFMVADLTRKVIGVRDNQLRPELFHHDLGVYGTLLMVADGLGGHEGGEIASQMVVDTIAQVLVDTAEQGLPLAEQITRAVEITHTAICQYHGASGRTRHMASTLTAVHVGHGTATIAQIGDSRAYRFSKGQLTLLTEDQTVVHMMQKKGLLSPEEALNHPHRNIILQALGQDKTVLPEIHTVPYQHNDCLLLCSDGLSSYVTHERITEIMATSPDEHLCCQQLVAAANQAGGVDNVTVLLARLIVQERKIAPRVERPAVLTGTRRPTQSLPRAPEPPRRRPSQEVTQPLPALPEVEPPAAPAPHTTRAAPLRFPWLGKAGGPAEEPPALVDDEATEAKPSLWKRDIRWPWVHKPPPPPASVTPPATMRPSDNLPPRSGSAHPQGQGAPVWEPHVLKVVEEQLASYLGPVAKILVSREAAQTRDVLELCHTLAAQLATEQERAAFTRSVLQHKALRARRS